MDTAGTVDYSRCGKLITSKINSITVCVVRDNQMARTLTDKTVNRRGNLIFFSTGFLEETTLSFLHFFFFLFFLVCLEKSVC